MNKATKNKRTAFVLIPLLGLSLLAFVLVPGKAPAFTSDAEYQVSGASVNYDLDEQKQDAPETHEPVFLSIFKFIVNCNPFKKETVL